VKLSTKNRIVFAVFCSLYLWLRDLLEWNIFLTKIATPNLVVNFFTYQRWRVYLHESTTAYIYIYIFIFIYLFICVCVCFGLYTKYCKWKVYNLF